MKKISFKKFTWKKFAILSSIFFMISLLISLIWDYFDQAANNNISFKIAELIRRGIMSLIMGLILACSIDTNYQKKE